MDYQSLFSRHRGLILPISIIACIGVLLVPLPPAMMDILLAGNIAISLIVLLTTISVRRPIEFSIFPTLLVATTLGRLVLNVGTTRLILTGAGNSSKNAAGGVIEAFGNFVAGDQIIVGIVIFAIIVAIQFLVITKGATRISEVAARFALDGMPGRQLAIDADLNSGAINEQEAQVRRLAVSEEADFYGAMDGASKFVRGDAIAAIMITLINIVGGLCLGIFSAGMSPSEAVSVFTKLTIGDGLASQIPAFLISIAAAILVTRSNKNADLPTQFLDQIFSQPQTLAISGVFLGLLIFTHLPTLPLLILGSACIGLSLLLSSQGKKQAQENEELEQRKKQEERKRPPAPEELLTVDPMRVELGAALIPLAAPSRGGDLMERVGLVRSSIASDMGFLLPKVRIKDNLKLDSNTYAIYLSGNLIVDAQVSPGNFLAIDFGDCRKRIDGEHFVEPCWSREALWITPEACETAIDFGYRVIAPSEYIAAHLQVLSRRYAEELLTREQTSQLVNQLKQTSPAIVEELTPDLMKLSTIQQVLKCLLSEDIPIRQLDLIFEALCDYAHVNSTPQLTQHVRNRVSRTITNRFSHGDRLQVFTLTPDLEDHILSCQEENTEGLSVPWSPPEIEAFCNRLQNTFDTHPGKRPVLLVRPNVRFAVRELTKARLENLVVLCHSEVSLHVRVENLGSVQHNSIPAAAA